MKNKNSKSESYIVREAENIIQKYLDLLKLTEKQINKVNSFRQKAGLEAI